MILSGERQAEVSRRALEGAEVAFDAAEVVNMDDDGQIPGTENGKAGMSLAAGDTDGMEPERRE